MNEKQKTNAAKGSLPPKTKAAVLWIIQSGTVIVIMVIVLSCVNKTIAYSGTTIPYLQMGIFFLLYTLPAILICTKNKIAWIFAMVILSGYLAGSLVYILPHIISEAKDSYFGFMTFIPLIFILYALVIPLILIIIDGKNYFKMIRQRKSDKDVRL